MAGPSVSILASFEDPVPSWRTLLEPYASHWSDTGSCSVSDTTKIGGEYLGEPCPFVGSIDAYEISRTEYPDEVFMRDSIMAKLGVKITHEIIVAAMCNQAQDHAILCIVAADIAENLNGYIDFDCLEAGADADIPGLERCEWTFDGIEDWTLIGTPTAARQWLSHPAFHMLK